MYIYEGEIYTRCSGLSRVRVPTLELKWGSFFAIMGEAVCTVSIQVKSSHWRLPRLALSQDFRKFAKKSKAGADQEKNSKMAGVAEKNPGFLAILQ